MRAHLVQNREDARGPCLSVQELKDRKTRLLGRDSNLVGHPANALCAQPLYCEMRERVPFLQSSGNAWDAKASEAERKGGAMAERSTTLGHGI